MVSAMLFSYGFVMSKQNGRTSVGTSYREPLGEMILYDNMKKGRGIYSIIHMSVLLHI